MPREDKLTDLDELAGETMSKFLDKYVREPLNRLIAEETTQPLADMIARDGTDSISIFIGGEELRIHRNVEPTCDNGDELPSDATD
jgi:hypothetical protein